MIFFDREIGKKAKNRVFFTGINNGPPESPLQLSLRFAL